MDFKKLSLDDIEKIRPFYSLVDSVTCDFTVGGMFMWRLFYDMKYMIDDGILFSTLKDESGNVYFNLPLSDNIESAIRQNISRFCTEEHGIRFCTVPEMYVPLFLKICPDARLTLQEDYSDYLYNSHDIITFGGKKYSAQRNQINQFMRLYPDWRFSGINDFHIEDVIRFFSSMKSDTDSTDTGITENKMVSEVLYNMDKYKMLGGVLSVEDKIIGFSLGEIVNNTLFTHIEKADRSYKGVYQVLANQFAKRFAADTDFINREEDMGDPGLRKAKKSYNPVSLLKKYIVEIN